jgi:transmembrane sensor
VTATQIDQNILDQALAWIVSLRGENVSEKHLEDFSDWLTGDESHQSAWDQALDLWETMGAVSYLPVDELLADDQVIVTNPSQTSADNLPGLLDRLQGLWKPMTLAFSLAVVGFIAVLNFQPQGDIYVAGTGQYLAVTLADGSVVELNTNSEISVSLNEDSREIELIKGEVFFTVAKDKDRPFIVDVAGATVRAVGTAFNIYRLTDQSAIVSVSEGIVRVEEAGGSSVATAQSQLLTVDEALQIDAVRGLSELNIEVAQATAWRNGHLLFDNTSIAEAIEILNRYLHKKVIVADDVSDSIKISGTFSSRQKKETLAAVAQALGLELSLRDNKWMLSQPKP